MGATILSFSVEPVGLGEAAAAFLAERDLARTTRRVYRLTLARLTAFVGEDAAVAELDAGALKRFLQEAYPAVTPATWNRNRAALKSFCAFCRRQGWMVADPTEAIERRRVSQDETRAVPYEVLEALWSRPDVPLREKALWRLLYDTAARASEALNLDVGDVDLPNKRARVTSKGGDVEWVHFASGSARLLPRLIRDRRAGPLFLASLRPAPARAPATADLDPASGRARLSYRRAAELFARYSGGLTLHQLRHSALTHLAEKGEATVMLMAKSRHRSLQTRRGLGFGRRLRFGYSPPTKRRTMTFDPTSALALGVGVVQMGLQALEYVRGIPGTDVLSALFDGEGNRLEGSDRISIHRIPVENREAIWFFRPREELSVARRRTQTCSSTS